MRMSHTNFSDSPSPGRSGPAGFTLVELLVVMGVLIVLTVLTLSLVNVTVDEDRVRSAAGSVQSFLEGARDRAIHAGEPRGVRFIRDTQDPNVVTSMLYIGPPKNYSEGYISIGDPANTSDRRRINLIGNANWTGLLRRGLIPASGAVLRISDRNLLFTIRADRDASGDVVYDASGNAQFRLTKDYNGALLIGEQYSLQLNPTVLPNQEPRQFPRDVVIDLYPNHSKIPSSWSSGNLDILFSPHGTVTGLVASEGVINLVVAEGVDVYQNRAPGTQNKEGNERIVSLRTQTGGISVHHVNPLNDPTFPNDPFRFAATGETAK